VNPGSPRAPAGICENGEVSFSVLFVCTGNICRSPAAERLFRARLPAGADVTVSSAGTQGLVGRPMDGPSALALRELGVDADRHVARRLTRRLIDEADLILTASEEHRSVVLHEAPLMLAKTFTLLEFARLGAGLAGRDGSAPNEVPTADQLRTRAAEVAGQRGIAEPAARGQDDVADPFGGSLDVARASVTAVSDAVDRVLVALGLA